MVPSWKEEKGKFRIICWQSFYFLVEFFHIFQRFSLVGSRRNVKSIFKYFFCFFVLLASFSMASKILTLTYLIDKLFLAGTCRILRFPCAEAWRVHPKRDRPHSRIWFSSKVCCRSTISWCVSETKRMCSPTPISWWESESNTTRGNPLVPWSCQPCSLDALCPAISWITSEDPTKRSVPKSPPPIARVLEPRLGGLLDVECPMMTPRQRGANPWRIRSQLLSRAPKLIRKPLKMNRRVRSPMWALKSRQPWNWCPRMRRRWRSPSPKIHCPKEIALCEDPRMRKVILNCRGGNIRRLWDSLPKHW